MSTDGFPSRIRKMSFTPETKSAGPSTFDLFRPQSAFNLKVIQSQDPHMRKWEDKYVIVAPLHFRVASELVMYLLSENVKVIGLTNHLKRAETLRSTLPYKNTYNFITLECDLHSIASMKATFQRIRTLFGEAQLLIYLLPKFVLDDTEEIFEPGNEMRLQQLLDVSLEAARMALRQAELALFPPCCDDMCNSEQMWIVRYGLQAQDEVVQRILERMSDSDCKTTLCGKTAVKNYIKPD